MQLTVFLDSTYDHQTLSGKIPALVFMYTVPVIKTYVIMIIILSKTDDFSIASLC